MHGSGEPPAHRSERRPSWIPRGDAAGIRLRWSDQDPYRTLRGFVLAGALLAVTLAIVGLPPVSIHGPQHFIGIMDPGCGLTRASRALAVGELRTAWGYNPASYALAAAAIAVLVASGIGWRTGHWPVATMTRPRIIYVFAVIAVAALWINQQLHAARLA